MAQPTRCDGRVGRRRLSHNNLRRSKWRRRLRRRRPRRSGSLRTEFGGCSGEHPFFLVAALPSRAARVGSWPAKRGRQHPGRRARRQSAPGRRAKNSQSTATERGDYRWRRRLRRRRRRRDSVRRFAMRGDVRCARPLFCRPVASYGSVTPSRIRTRRITSQGARRSTTSMPATTVPNTV